MERSDLAEQIKFFKETETGRRELSGLDAKIFEEGIEKGEEKIILSMLSNDLSIQIIAKWSGYPEKKIKELKTRFIEEGRLPA